METGVKAMNLSTAPWNPAERAKDVLPFRSLFDNATESFFIGYKPLSAFDSDFSSYVPIGL